LEIGYGSIEDDGVVRMNEGCVVARVSLHRRRGRDGDMTVLEMCVWERDDKFTHLSLLLG